MAAGRGGSPPKEATAAARAAAALAEETSATHRVGRIDEEARMVGLLALYGKPEDEDAFGDYYREVHYPLAAAILGVQSYEHGRVYGGSEDVPSYHYAAVLTFQDRGALESGLASEAGRKVAADLANFATGGVKLLFVDYGKG